MNTDMMKKATEGLAAKPHKGKKKPKITIMPADNDGYHVQTEQDQDGMPMQRMNHVFEKLKGVHDHIDKHYGGAKKSKAKPADNPAEELEETMASPAPASGQPMGQ